MSEVKELKAGKYLTWLPVNARIMKMYCGIGGSTSEITAKRNSIIMMPSFKAVVQKSNTKSNIYDITNISGIYGGHNEVKGLMSFLKSDVKYKKIIMTMSRKSITVLLEAAKECPELFKFNLMLDEVDQIQDDGNWREDLSLCYDLVSMWKYEIAKVLKEGGKEMGSVSVISATGVESITYEAIAKLPLWKVAKQEGRNNFKIEILKTTEIEATAATVIANITDNKAFIFYNNVDGSKRIINAINKKDCRIYCGEGSENKAREYYSTDLTTFGNYNFCTKAYFRAVDFSVDGEVVIISDINSLHAGLNVEDIVQSLGRIRKQIKKVTIIMNTKENKSKLAGQPKEKVQSFFRDIANQQLGTIKTLDAVGELTESFFEGNEAVRRNIKGEFAINYAWIEGRVKAILEDNVAYESTDNMVKALEKYDMKATVIANPEITCSVRKEDLDWKELIEYVEKLQSSETVFTSILKESLSDNEKLIVEGITKLGIEVVKTTDNKTTLKDKIKEFDSIDRLSSVGLAICKKFKTNIFIPSAEAKTTMKEIYKLLGYEATAKATDLDVYFNDFKETTGRVEGKIVKGVIVGSPKYSINQNN